MTTITLNRKNFWDKIWLIYKELIDFWEIKLEIKSRKRTEDTSLKEYIKSWEIDNSENIDWTFNNVEDLILNLNQHKNYGN